MGITRNNRHKRRATGGKKKHYRKDRKFEMGHQPTNTKMGERKTSLVRMRGGKMKVRAIRLDAGNFSWASEGMGRKSRILGVKYNATSNELVRTNTLVKNAIIEIDASPFRLWFEQHYGIKLVKKKKVQAKKPVKPTGAAAKKGAKPAAGAKKGAAKKAAAAKPAEKPKTEVAKPAAVAKKESSKPKKEGATGKPGRVGKLGEDPQPTADFPYTRKTHSKAAHAVAAALLKRYKLSIRKRAKLVAKAGRMQREEKREERKFQKAKAAYLKAKAEGKAPAEFPYEVKKQLGEKIAKHFIASRQAYYRKKRPVRRLDAHLLEQFQTGRLFACISSRPGQDGCADGYILEGKELEFYIKKMKK